jgi:hypothetical protein
MHIDFDLPGNVKVAPLARAERARLIVAGIRAAAVGAGRWERVDLGEGRDARVWVVDVGDGLEASITSAFSGVPRTSSPSSYDEALQMQRMPPPPEDDVTIDLYLEAVGKVLSVGTRDGVDRVISMVPGPWEASFGLPARPWSPALQRRLGQRA